MPKLYVVRHAEPEITGVLLGRTDPALSEAGRQAAKEKLTGLRVDRVYSSPLRRCVETAGYIGAPVRVDVGLCEIHLGEWDGLSWGEIERRYPEQAAHKAADWFGVTPPGGEPWPDFAARVREALERVTETDMAVAIVGHVAVNAVIAEALTGVDPVGFIQEYCGVLEFETHGWKRPEQTD